MLEALNLNTIRLRSPNGFQSWSIIYPSNCTQPSPMSMVYREAIVGDTLTATLCSGGSTALVTVFHNANRLITFRVMRWSNTIVAQRIT